MKRNNSQITQKSLLSENNKTKDVNIMMMELTKDKIIEEIENQSEKINQFGVKEIGLFGSYLKGEPKEESDIDILVQFKEDEKSFDNYMGLKFFLEDLFDREVDLVIKNTLKDHLKDEILRSTKYAARV